MRLHRFILDVDVSQPELFVADPEILMQWMRVLRLRVGDTVILCDGQGQEAWAELLSLDRGGAQLKLEPAITVDDLEPEREVILYAAIIKGENFEWAAQKAVECGVARIVPVISERTIKKEVALPRLKKIVKEAVEQSGRGVLPRVHEPLPFDLALAEASAHDAVVFFDGSGENFTADLLKDKETVGIFIGPEGGFSELEVDLARQKNFSILTLGSRTLRAETASAVATYLAAN